MMISSLKSSAVRRAAGALAKKSPIMRALSTELEQSYRLAAGSSSNSSGNFIAASSSSPSRSVSSSTTNTTSTSEDKYESPMKDIFDRMYMNGPTTLGTTDEWIQFEKDIERHEQTLQCGIPERFIRFTSTSYGRILSAPYVHSNEHRVILKINRKFLPLNDIEIDILKEIVGDRLTDNDLRLTTNQFGSRIENKRYLVSMLDRLILSCQKIGTEIKAMEEAA